MPVRAVIFDLDQTLLDRSASLLEFLRWQSEGMLRSDLENPADFVSRFLELDDNGRVWKDEVYRRLIEEFDIGRWRMEELLAVYESCFCGFCVSRTGVEQAIQELAANYRLGLISNGKTPFQERNFRALGYAEVFDSILVSEAVGLRKPDARIFRLGCSELEVAPDEAVYVGDNPIADIKGAREAGLRTIFVPVDSDTVCEEADATCNEMGALPDLISKL
ncbi:MAG: HAD family hydrolase [Verrucomicrobiae bacterium]|nr:HAD family hydrolase [Verrucomicrobiae bacterium]